MNPFALNGKWYWYDKDYEQYGPFNTKEEAEGSRKAWEVNEAPGLN